MAISTRASSTPDAVAVADAGPVPGGAAPAAASFGRRLRRNRAALMGVSITALFVLVALAAPLLTPYDPIRQDLAQALHPPSAPHWLGTDELGRDILSRILVGARISFLVSLSAVAAALSVGAGLGIIAGYAGGRADAVIMRIMDILLALPGILLAITIIAILGAGLVNVVAAISVYSIPTFARLARSTTLVVRELDYVAAARAVGSPHTAILLRHILPNVAAPLLVQSTLRIGTAILTASGLSFLGLGAQPPTPEWGAMLSNGRSYLTSSPHVATFPGVAIMLVVFGFNLLGDGLRDILDPRLRT